ncbi:MAG TPA: GNAT family N-acetyltransferase [Candidatus Paceibacterota bacterium]|nr:GNAT family N-acetyltransferase [Candidatus Paceibacterota bacterium]
MLLVSSNKTERFKKKIFENDLGSGNGAIFLIEENKEAIGYIFVLLFIPGMEKYKKDSPAYISDLYVKKSFRKKGFAIKLIKESEKWAKSKNKKEIILDVETFNNKALNLYKKIKFKPISFKLKKELK